MTSLTTFGYRIRKLREEKNLTQTELSQLLGMKTYTTVSKWESDDNFPKGKDIKLLAKLFNVSSDYLLGLKSERQESITSIYDQLDDSQKKEVYLFAKEKLKINREHNN